MNITINNPEFIKFMQEGGAAPAPTEDPNATPAAPELGGDPMELILQAAAEAVQTQNALLALQVCLALVEMAGGGAPAPGQVPEGSEPVYRRGGKLLRFQKK